MYVCPRRRRHLVLVYPMVDAAATAAIMTIILARADDKI